MSKFDYSKIYRQADEALRDGIIIINKEENKNKIMI